MKDNVEFTSVLNCRRKSVSAEVYNPEEGSDISLNGVFPKNDEQRLRLLTTIDGVCIFNGLDSQQRMEVIDSMHEMCVKTGDVLYEQGDDGNQFYIFDNGSYDVLIDGAKVTTLETKGSFGEIALMYNTPRTATVQAKSNSNLWTIDRASFRKIVLKNALKKRKSYDAILSNITSLEPLSFYERMNLADALISKNFSDGQVIIRQGDTADGLYFVISGTVRVVIISGDREEEVSKKGSGSFFGELALLKKSRRSANVLAVGDVSLAFLDSKYFDIMLSPCFELMNKNSQTYIYP